MKSVLNTVKLYIKRNKRAFAICGLICYMFFLLFQPPLLKANVLHLCVLIALPALFFNKIEDKVCYPFIYFLGLLTIFFSYGQIVNYSLNFGSLYAQIITMGEIYICALYIKYVCQKYNISLTDFCNVLLVTSLIQAILAIFAFCYPSIQDAFLKFKLDNTVADPAVIEYLKTLRLYGFCTNYTFTMPLFQGLVILISLYSYLTKGGIWRIFLIVPIAFSGVINARNIIVLLLAGVVLVAFFAIGGKYTRKRILTLLGFAVSALLLIIIVISCLDLEENKTFLWIQKGIDELKQLFKGERTGTFELLFTGWQSDLSLKHYVFGIGRFVMGDPYKGYVSDIGFINYMYLGGLLFSFVLYVGVGYFLWKTWKKGEDFRFLALLLAIAFILGNIKGYVFGNNEMVICFCIFYALTLKLNRREALWEKNCYQ